MGFLKSLSRSIKRPSSQHSTDQVSEFGTITPTGPVQGPVDPQVETAGIKRPSGQGVIARRDRGRSSEDIHAVQTGSQTCRDDHASVSSYLIPQPHSCQGNLTYRHFAFALISCFSAQPYATLDSPAEPLTVRPLTSAAHQPFLNAKSSAESQQPHAVHLASIAQQSSPPSFRPSIPHEIIITPSSPRKPDSPRTKVTYLRPSTIARPPLERQSGSFPLACAHGAPIMDPVEVPLFANTGRSRLNSQSERELGLGRPLAFSHDHWDTTQRSELLTPTSTPAQRSASLPAPNRREATVQPCSPQNRFVSFATQDLSTLDDNFIGDTNDRLLRIKTIRKTRSLSDIISRNRKAPAETDCESQRPLFTWSAAKGSNSVQSSEPAIAVTMPKKKGNNLLKTAVDLLQFRKSRRTSSTEAEAGKNDAATPSPSGSEQDTWTIDLADTVASGLASPRLLAGGSSGINTPSHISTLDQAAELCPPRQDPSGDNDLASNVPLQKTESLHEFEQPVATGTASAFKTDDSNGTASERPDLPPAIFSSTGTFQHLDGSLPGSESRKPNLTSRSKSGITMPLDWVFKRPLLGPRAQSANSTPEAEWLGSSPMRGAGDSISRSTTIRAVNRGSPRPPSGTSTPSESPSLSQSRQDSIDGYGFEPSLPISILRADPPHHSPSSYSALGSPSVSFGGDTPRVSISSSSSRADSALNHTRSRRYTSVSQENINNSLPFHGVKISRPRSSTLFSTAPVWLAPSFGTGNDKKRASLMRRLSGGLIGNPDDSQGQSSPRTPSQERVSGISDNCAGGAEGNVMSLAGQESFRQSEETTQEWIGRISELVGRPNSAAFLASK